MNEHRSPWLISGIQQLGIGVPDVEAAFAWHRAFFGMDVPIFDDEGEAGLMLPYTGGKPHARRAILAANLAGGSAFEIWQYKSRSPVAPPFKVELGDLGIFAARMKTRDVAKAYAWLSGRREPRGGAAGSGQAAGAVPTGPANRPDSAAGAVATSRPAGAVARDPSGREHFFFSDPLGLLYDVVPGDSWFTRGAGRGHAQGMGGVAGCLVGVSDIDRARSLYGDILGYDSAVYDATGTFEDFASLPGGGGRFRRVLLEVSRPRAGAFSRLFGESRIELVQALSRTPRKIFEGRFWGDVGFIHLCFDVRGMGELQEECRARGFDITVDSASSFDMGEAAGHFCYIEDPDGTLIEFVETHRLPIMKKLGLYLNLRRRDPQRPLPDWMIRALGLGRVRD